MLVTLLAAYYTAPLSTIAQVLRSRCSTSLLWPLCLMNGINGALWAAYGVVGSSCCCCCCCCCCWHGGQRAAPWRELCARAWSSRGLALAEGSAPERAGRVLPSPPQAIRDWFIAGPQAFGAAASAVALALCWAFPREPPAGAPADGKTAAAQDEEGALEKR
jgi:hypothetical protein